MMLIQHDPTVCVSPCHRVTDQIDAILLGSSNSKWKSLCFKLTSLLYVQRCWVFPVCRFVSTFVQVQCLILKGFLLILLFQSRLLQGCLELSLPLQVPSRRQRAFEIAELCQRTAFMESGRCPKQRPDLESSCHASNAWLLIPHLCPPGDVWRCL